MVSETSIYFSKFVIVCLFCREDLLKAKVTKDWRDISEYFSVTFNSFTEINAAFRVSFVSFQCSQLCIVVFVICIR